jgi:ATP-dependent helicase/nuclease subunit A
MTRAIDRLIVCGADGERKRPDGCWWDLVFDALQPVSVEEPADDGDGKVWRYRKDAGGPGVHAGVDAQAASAEKPAVARQDAHANARSSGRSPQRLRRGDTDAAVRRRQPRRGGAGGV